MRRTQLCGSEASPTPLHPRASKSLLPPIPAAHTAILDLRRGARLSVYRTGPPTCARASTVGEPARGLRPRMPEARSACWVRCLDRLGAYHAWSLIFLARHESGAQICELTYSVQCYLLDVQEDPYYCDTCGTRCLLRRLLFSSNRNARCASLL